MDAMLGYMGEESFNRSLDLRTALRKLTSETAGISIQAPSTSSQIPPTSSQPQPASHDIKNIPKLMSGLSLTPWKASEIPTVLPPLPAILDKALDKATFIHAGTNVGKVTELNYERLEWLGDAYIELAATLLISQTFPFKTAGKCAQLRERLVKNVTLAGYARKYGFDKRATLPAVFMEGNNSRNSAKDDQQIKACMLHNVSLRMRHLSQLKSLSHNNANHDLLGTWRHI
jgi:ribonuclease-3